MINCCFTSLFFPIPASAIYLYKNKTTNATSHPMKKTKQKLSYYTKSDAALMQGSANVCYNIATDKSFVEIFTLSLLVAWVGGY